MNLTSVPPHVEQLLVRYCARLDLGKYPLRVTCSKQTFESWIGRRVSSSIGGGYTYRDRLKSHLILVNLKRIRTDQPNAVEIVVAEEMLHMRHWIDGDRRRHSHHGYDRVAVQVANLVGCPMDDVRNCLIPVKRRPIKYLYRCPSCGIEIPRKRSGTWSCGKCSPRFDRRYVLEVVKEFEPGARSERD